MKIKILIGVAALIFLGGVIASVVMLQAPHKNKVNILRDGKVLYSLDLSKEENRRFEIPYGDSSNTVEIKDGSIRVCEAECPDKTCVHTGWLRSSAMPIVCLPNHLVIEFAGTDGEIDALAG
ncbi:MAG: NusG domain II-containing protein [Ruminococcus sp.]|nr:NusG domain II-containing protein [Ruminococcus sp.]